MLKNRLLIIIYTLFLLILLSSCSNDKGYTEPEDSDLEEGMEYGGVSYSLQEMDGTFTSFEKPLTPKNGNLKHQFTFSHEFSFEANYALIILVDAIQSNFVIDGQEYSYYPFTLNPEETIELDVNVSGIKDANEISYTVIFQPDYQLEEGDISRAQDLYDITYIKRNLFREETNQDEGFFNFEKPAMKSKKGVNSFQIRLLRKKNDFTLMTRAKSQERIFAEIGNDLDVEIHYSIIALQDWKQVPFEDGELIKHVNVPPGNSHYYHLELPKVKDAVNYQLIAFPMTEHELSYSILSSPRIVIVE